MSVCLRCGCSASWKRSAKPLGWALGEVSEIWGVPAICSLVSMGAADVYDSGKMAYNRRTEQSQKLSLR